ncbi:hypothetical protein SynRS9909_01117 [Synechococcus sp. RS9909]|nr:hypothetical protein SynRS9909_01117 [Synechococcus sp. RS9909]
MIGAFEEHLNKISTSPSPLGEEVFELGLNRAALRIQANHLEWSGMGSDQAPRLRQRQLWATDAANSRLNQRTAG